MLVSVTSAVAVNSGAEINVTFLIQSEDGENAQRQSFLISSKQYLVLGISKGECSMELYDETEHSAEIWSAVKKGTSVLGYGAYSKKALRAKLTSKGFSKEVAADAVEELEAMGLLNENGDAHREAQRGVGKLWGKKRIVAGLYEKGYSPEAIHFALCSLEDEDVDFVQNCRTLIEKKYGNLPTDPLQRKKAISSLLHYGYSPSEIKDAGDAEDAGMRGTRGDAVAF